MKNLEHIDPIIFDLIKKEESRQQNTIDLIASENITSTAIMQATGSVLTNKYAEGYPGKRYYAGCEVVDAVEQIAIDRCKQLFKAEHANVQPHAGCQANMAIYYAALNIGDTVMGMSLAEGGHLTHGHKVNFSGKFYKSVQYTVNKETELIDYDEIERLAHEHKPKLIIAGASAYSRTIDFKRFSAIARSVGAYFLADIAHIAGLVATDLHPTPVPYADFVTSTTHKTLQGPRGAIILSKQEHAVKIDSSIIPGTQGGPFMNVIAAKAVAFAQAQRPEFKIYQENIIANAQAMVAAFQELGYRIVTGGTDNHLFVVDLRNKNINGKQAQDVLEKVGIIVSRSCIPFDPEKPWITSGIRIGTPTIAARFMMPAVMPKIVHLIHETLLHRDDDVRLNAIAQEVRDLCKDYPIAS